MLYADYSEALQWFLASEHSYEWPSLIGERLARSVQCAALVCPEMTHNKPFICVHVPFRKVQKQSLQKWEADVVDRASAIIPMQEFGPLTVSISSRVLRQMHLVHQALKRCGRTGFSVESETQVANV